MKPLSTLARPILALILLVPFPASGDERDDKIKELEKRLEALEKKYQALGQEYEAQQAQSAEKAKAAPTLSVGASGFTLRSADTNFALRFRGLLQLDYRDYFGEDSLGGDTFTLRRARPILGGTVFRDFDFLFTPDFGGSQKNIIRDVWLNYRDAPELQLRAGKMKPPGNLEWWQGAANTLLIERSVVSDLSPNRDLGVMPHGELWPGDESFTRRLGWNGIVNYAVGLFNGVGDGWNAE